MANITSRLQLTPTRPYGGGSVLPEDDTASALNQGAGGLGLTPSASQPTPMPAMPQAQQQPLIDYKQNPFGAAGLVLSSMAAGMRGDPSPVAQLQEQRQKQQEMQFKQAELAQNVIERYAPIVMNDPAHADEIIAHGKQIFQGALGNMDVGPLIKAMAASGAEKFKATMAALKEVNPSTAMLQYWSRNPAAAMKTLDEYNGEKAKALAKPPDRKTRQVNRGDQTVSVYEDTGQEVPGSSLKIARSPNAPQTNLNLETTNAPRADYRYVRDANGKVINEEVIPGSKTDIDQKALAKKDAADQAAKAAQNNIVSQDIGRALDMLDHSSFPVAGLFGSTAARIPGTPAADFAGIIGGIESNIAINKITEMRKNSPTGAALGNASDNDVNLLKSVYGSLKNSTSEESLRFNLTRLRDTFNLVVNGTVSPVAKADYKSAADVAAAVKSGRLPYDEGAAILRDKFGAK